MQQKELRLGVVLTGGVSLVVYMHGVTKELLKLARASRSYHQRGGGAAPDAYADSCPGREVDTERVYFDLLEALGDRLDLRIVIDVIAGASAGGVNGIVLARALAHDLDMDAHRQMWLEHADAIELLDRHAGRWSKAALRPLLGWVLRRSLRAIAPEKETRDKLTDFVRSRWFQPPFSGRRYAQWLLEAIDAMERHAPRDRSLLPDNHPLDLTVSITDFHGYQNRIALHSPSEISERDHRQVLQFCYVRRGDGEPHTDFDYDSVPGLVFAARATSCFPGAFPPARIAEIDDVVAGAERAWPRRDAFIADKLGSIAAHGRAVETVYFIDGSVVNDKPFGAAIAAITGKPAYRSVTRRILFIEPSPVEIKDVEETAAPGFFRTILSALAEIPRNEPIHDDLERINAFNRHTKLVRQVLERVQPMVDGHVDAMLPPAHEPLQPTVREIAGWRAAANQQAADQAGYAFESYFRLKVLRVGERLAALTATLSARDAASGSPAGAAAHLMAALGLDTVGPPANRKGRSREIGFLKAFDVEFRIRRLRFVIRRLNMLYRLARVDEGLQDQTARLDELKTTLYGLIEEAKRRWDPALYDGEAAALVRSAASGDTGIAHACAGIGKVMGLDRLDAEIDEVFAVMVLNYIPEGLRRDLFSSYLGFAFFDVMSYPMTLWDGFEELEEILIDRISPADAVAIRAGGAASTLRGTEMRKFAGFFNRAYRENDYLWGRLNAADRLVDIVLGAVEETDMAHGVDAAALKQRLFMAVLDAEEPFLKADADLVPALRREILALGDASG